MVFNNMAPKAQRPFPGWWVIRSMKAIMKASLCQKVKGTFVSAWGETSCFIPAITHSAFWPPNCHAKCWITSKLDRGSAGKLILQFC